MYDDEAVSSFRRRRSHRSRQTASFRHDFCDLLCGYGGPELFGFYLALRTWMPDGTILISPDQEPADRLAKSLGTGVERFWQLAGRLYECGLLEIESLDNRPLRLDETAAAILILHEEPPVSGRLHKLRDLIGWVNQGGQSEAARHRGEAAASAEAGAGAIMRVEARLQNDVLERFKAMAEAEQVGEIYERFRQAFGGGAELSRSECEKLVAWLEEWPPVMLLLALDEALLHSARSFRYIDRILLNWKKQRIETPEQVLALKRERDAQYAGSGIGGREEHVDRTARRRTAPLRFGQRPVPGSWEHDEDLW